MAIVKLPRPNNNLISHHYSPSASLAGRDPEDFLRRLGGASCLHFPGQDPHRTRAVVTLLHGNEPSGCYAIRRWLLQGLTPAVNLLCYVMSVDAALAEPAFAHRMLPGRRDLNRCFGTVGDDLQGLLAQALIDDIAARAPEALIDIHNTSGSGPPFAVVTEHSEPIEALVRVFTHRMVISQLRLGTLMERAQSYCPTITAEVGGRSDDAAHETAWEGLRSFACHPHLNHQSNAGLGVFDQATPLDIYCDSVRLELKRDVSLTYAQVMSQQHDLTLLKDIERFNFDAVKPGSLIGWSACHLDDLFRAVDLSGRSVLQQLLIKDGDAIVTVEPQRLFMVTSNAAIAVSDCLYYTVVENLVAGSNVIRSDDVEGTAMGSEQAQKSE